ncbi:MAG: cyclic nucleotide-binding domain-containing protein [Chloroflexota bacterium]|jgi:CRP-like cAMP-binding protein
MRDPAVAARSALIARYLPDLSPRQRQTLALMARDERPALGTYLMREGRPTLDLGVIVEGRLAVRDRIGRDDVTLMTLDSGDVFGWSAVLDGISTASIVGDEGARVLLFDGAALRDALAADRAMAVVLYRRLLEAVARRLDATRLLARDIYAFRGSP